MIKNLLKWITIGLILTFTPIFCFAQLYNGPESMVWDELNNRYLVSNHLGGTVVQIDSTGQESYLLQDLVACAGLEIVDNILYVACCENGIKGFDLTTDEPEMIMDIMPAGMTFINDLTSDSQGYLYATDWHPGSYQIHKIRLSNHQSWIFKSGIYDYTNGIYCDEENNRLLIVGRQSTYSSFIGSITLTDSTQMEVHTTYSADGITEDNSDNIYISAWHPTLSILKFENGDLSNSPVVAFTGYESPADIYFDKKNNVMCVPDYYPNAVDFIPMQFTKVTEGNIVNDGGGSWGANWIDYDNDSYLDVFVSNTSTGVGNFLYHNDGDGSFSKILDDIIVTDPLGWGGGSSWGDFDNDGDSDVVIVNWDDEERELTNNLFYQNNGDGTFTKITEGIIANDAAYCISPAWIDYDNDGDLDLYMANHGGPPSYEGENFLYRNDDGEFVKITNGEIVTDIAISNNAVWADYDNDGYLDVFVSNFGSNNLYKNNGDGTFDKITSGDIVNDSGSFFGASWGDYDNDDDMDLFVTNIGDNLLYENNGDGTFTKITDSILSNDGGSSFGSGWADYDNDGDLDLFVANGSYNTGEANFLYKNNGNGNFTKISEGSWVTDLQTSEGIAWGDCDRDGDLDLFITNSENMDEDNALYINNGNLNNWINIKCISTSSNASAIGAKVAVKAMINGNPTWQYREISSQTGKNGQSSMNVHFGLGNATIIDSLKIHWPGGNTEIQTSINVNQFLEITQTETGIQKEISIQVPEKMEIRNYPNPFNPNTIIEYNLFTSGRVKLTIYDISGKLIRTLVDKNQQAGIHTVNWDGKTETGKEVQSGIYICKFKTENHKKTKRMTLLK